MLAPLDLVIVAPPFGCSTPAVYRAWDGLGGPPERAIDDARRASRPFVNDLEPAADAVEPGLPSSGRALEAVIESPGVAVGSGSAYAVWFDDR